MLAAVLGMATGWAGTAETDAVVVGLGTAGFQVVGLLGGGAAGLGIGGATCGGNGFECGGPVVGAAVGAVGGTVAGGLGGGAVMSWAVGRRPGRSAAYAAVGLGAGLALGAVAQVAQVDALGWVAITTSAVGMPVGAAIGAYQAPSRSSGPAVTVSPMVGRRTGLQLAGTF